MLSDREATASLIIPHIKVISHIFDMGEEKGLFDWLGSTLTAWKAFFSARFRSYLKGKNLILAPYLDPRCKTTFSESNYQGMLNGEAIAVWFTEESQGGVPGVTGTLEKANSHFDPTQTGSGTAPPR